MSTQALANPGQSLADHLDRQERYSGLVGGDLDEEVTASVDLPPTAVADEVRIIGECQAVYVGTGETFTPWVEAGTRPIDLTLTRTSDVLISANGEIPLAEWTGHHTTRLVLDREVGRYRLALRGGGRDTEGEWIEPALGTPLRLQVTPDQSEDFVIELDGVEEDLRVPMESHDADWYWRPNVLRPLVAPGQPLVSEGIQVDAADTPLPSGCEDRLARYREQAPTG